MDSSVSNKQKLKIRFREILELVLMVGCGIPICSGVYGGFLVLSPMVLLILGAFALAGVAHFLMTNTWKTECEGSFCYKNNGKLSFVFTLLKLEVVLFILPIALSTIVLGLLQVFNPAVALVLGTVSLAIFSRVALLRWGQSKNDQNRENSNDACKYDFDLSERIWLKFMTITFPIACALLLLSALAGILSFATAGVCCIPFGGIGLFTGLCFLWSKYREPRYNKELKGAENDRLHQNNLIYQNSIDGKYYKYSDVSNNEPAPGPATWTSPDTWNCNNYNSIPKFSSDYPLEKEINENTTPNREKPKKPPEVVDINEFDPNEYSY